MKPTEYKVDADMGMWAAGPFQDWLNAEAEVGWKFVAAFWTAHQQLFCVFEREVEVDETD